MGNGASVVKVPAGKTERQFRTWKACNLTGAKKKHSGEGKLQEDRGNVEEEVRSRIRRKSRARKRKGHTKRKNAKWGGVEGSAKRKFIDQSGNGRSILAVIDMTRNHEGRINIHGQVSILNIGSHLTWPVEGVQKDVSLHWDKMSAFRAVIRWM